MKYKAICKTSSLLSPLSIFSKRLSALSFLTVLLSLSIRQINGINSGTNSTTLMQNIVSETYSTAFDGANQDIYVSYLQLSGKSGLEAPIESSGQLNKDLDYTIMMWVKLTGDDWNRRDQYAFAIPGSFQCYFTQSSQLVCESSLKCEKLRVSSEAVKQNVWTHITVSGYASTTSYLSLESRTDIIGQDQSEYTILQQPQSPWKACIGVCLSEAGIIGGVREFLFIQQYINKERSAYLKNHYFTWDFSILAYFRLSDKSLLNDDFRSNKATLVGTKSIDIAFDYVSNDICYPFQFQEEHMIFTRDYQFQNQSIGDRWSPKYTDYSYTMSIWIMPSPNHCYTESPVAAKTDCTIVLFDGVFMLYFDTPSTAKFYFFALQNYYEISSPPFLVPNNQWINIQMTMEQYNGYAIQTYDQQGRLMSNLQKTYNMQEQRPAKKEFALLQNFRGSARSFYLMGKAISLPVQPKMDTSILSDDFIYYFKFLPKYNGKQLTNQGSNNGVSQDILFSFSPVYQYSTFYDSTVNGKSKQGLASSPTPLFDGIACNDLKLSLQTISNNSYVKGSTALTDDILNSTTVEFWFRPYDFGSINYLFQLYSSKLAHEFFAIYKNSNGQLICAPFGIDSIRSPFITYEAINEESIILYKWFHISCSFKYSDLIVGSVSRMDLDKEYSASLEENQNYLPSEKLEIYIGNKNTKNAGSKLTFFKEVRVWGKMRTSEEIKQWRYRQLNPFAYDNSTLLAYYRLTEGTYEQFNYLSLMNPKAQKTAVSSSVQYSVDSEISVCPQLTYSFNSTCYNKPLRYILPTVYPVYNSADDSLKWKFSLTDSAIFDQSLFNELTTTWFIYDDVLHSTTIGEINDLDMEVAEEVFAQQQIYKIGANITNYESTFLERMDINFIPINCQWVVVKDSDAFSASNHYKLPQSTQDITFQLNVKRKENGCSSYYNKLVPTVTYYINPVPVRMPLFVFDYSDSDETLLVTIPKDQQSLMPILTDVKIILNIYWTNSEYAEIMDTSNYIFQNVLYTLRFDFQSMTVIPILTVNSDFALKDDSLNLDGRLSYITKLQAPEKYQNLAFSWQCPSQLAALCQGQSASQLTILYDQFIASGGIINETYTFTMIVTWKPTEDSELQFFATQPLTWYDTINPQFTLSNSTMILSTSQSVFNLLFKNYNAETSSNLNIQWSIVPNISNALMTLSNDSNTLTVQANGFNLNTNYQVKVIATNKINSIASHVETITFITKYPPFGGKASISPSTGFIDITNFTVSLSNWQSDFAPILYQLWQSASAQGNSPVTQISSGWLNANQNFTFVANSSNSFLVLLTDASMETVLTSPIIMNIQVKAENQTNVTSLISKLQVSKSNTVRYSLMNQLSDQIPIQDSATQSQIVQVLLDEIASDTNTLTADTTLSTDILTNSVQVLTSVLSNQETISASQAQQSVAISKSLSKSKKFKSQLSKDSNLMSNYASSLGNLLSIGDSITSNGKRRLQSVVNIYEDVYEQIQDLATNICSDLGTTYKTQTLSTPQFQLTLQQFNQFDNEKEYKFSYQDEEQTFIQLYASKFIDEMMQISNIDSSSYCAQTLFLLVNPYSPQMTSQHISKYSKTITKFDIVDGSMISVQPYIDYNSVTSANFQIKPNTFVNNQTICVQYSDTEESWNSNNCDTSIDVSKQSINCYCTMSNYGYYTLAKDTSRHEGPKLFSIESIVGGENSHEDEGESRVPLSQSLSVLSIILTIIGFGTLIPLLSYFLDKKDKKYLSEKLEAGVKLHLLMKVVQVSKEPLSYWVYKKDQILSYNIESTTLFSHLMSQMHPFFSILTKFDILESRIVRFSIYFLQFSCFSLICVISFGPYYRSQDLERNDAGIDQKDISSIVIVGLVGMVMLLPIPCSLKCLNAKLSQKQTISQNAPTVNSRAQQYLAQVTQEQNILQNSPPAKDKNQDDLVDNDTEMIKSVSQTQSEMIFKPQCSLVKYLMLATSYIISIAAISLAIVYSQQQKHAFNQYCQIASFYIGLFGSLFISNILRIIFNMLTAPYQLSKNNGCLRLFVSSDAIRVVKEIGFVREAEKSLYRSSITNVQQSKSVVNNVSVEDLSQRQFNGNCNNEGEFDENLERSIQKDNALPTVVEETFIRKPKYLPPISINTSQNKGEISSKSKKPEYIEEGLRRSVIEKVINSIEKKNKPVKYSCVTEQENSCQRIQQNVPSDQD